MHNKLEEYIEKHHKNHLIFDFDETIFRLVLPWERCFAFKEKELRALDNALIESYFQFKIGWSDLQNILITQYGEKAKKIILENNRRFETELLEDVEINHELLEFVQKNKDKTLFIWSSNTQDVVEKVLRDFGIQERFEKIITRTDVSMLKDHPEGFGMIADGQTPKESYVMIGDSVHDKNAAENAGIDFYQISYF